MIIRDNVYGDIEIPVKFVKLIDTYEFQRLRRIKQLATADQVFPGATHSRFSHSIGTYYVMKKILVRFEEILKSIGQEECVKAEEKDIILAAALLHDIGHGPFSHAFEKAKISSETNTHEMWTIKIITDPSTEICRELETWGAGTAQKVADYITYRREVKDSDQSSEDVKLTENPDFKFIFTSLVSSQLDADRMDYLLRDSMHCGVTFGKFDLDNLIAGMEIGINGEENFRVCINKNYLANVEEYFCARYQMYKNIYFHPYKVMSETLLEKILNKACQYYLEGKLPTKYIPTLVREIFDHADISLQDYLRLDDTVVVGAIHMWAQIGDLNDDEKENDELSDIYDLIKLCEHFLYRNGYKQILLNKLDTFLSEVEELLRDEQPDNYQFIKDLLFIKCSNAAKIYDKSDSKPVYILSYNGTVQNLSEISGLVGAERNEATIYYNREFCQKYLSAAGVEKVEQIINRYDSRKTVEIEKKYIVESIERVYADIKEVLKSRGYEIIGEEQSNQIDHYYDDNTENFYQAERTLRIREKNGRYWMTIKAPSITASNGKEGQLERNEREREVASVDIKEYKEAIEEELGSFFSDKGIAFHELRNNINIRNNRKKLVVVKNAGTEGVREEKYEIVFDDVEYINVKTDQSYKEQQVEIELKSDVQTRINMKGLTDALERKITDMQSTAESKYHRAVDNVIHSKAR